MTADKSIASTQYYQILENIWKILGNTKYLNANIVLTLHWIPSNSKNSSDISTFLT